MRIGIHQPEYLPWPGFLNKMFLSDIYVVLDTAKFSHGDFHNRNKIKTSQGAKWLTIPISGSKMLPLSETKIDNSRPWQNQHWENIKQSYSHAPYFYEISDFFKDIYLNKKFEKLTDLTTSINKFLADFFGLKTKITNASTLHPLGKSTDALINICQKLNGSIYLSGIGGKNYLEEAKFRQAGLALEYQNFNPPVYPQLFGKFMPYLSAIDIISNIGREQTAKLIFKKYD